MTDMPDDIVAHHLDVARMGVQDAVRLYLQPGSKVRVDDVVSLMRSVLGLIQMVGDMTQDERTALGQQLKAGDAGPAGDLFRAVMGLRSAINAMVGANAQRRQASRLSAAPPAHAPEKPSGATVVVFPPRKPRRDD